MVNSNFSLVSHCDDNDNSARGEGITRTASPRAQLFPVEIRFQQGRPMRCTIRATSQKQARQFAINRHPLATGVRFIPKKEAAQWL